MSPGAITHGPLAPPGGDNAHRRPAPHDGAASIRSPHVNALGLHVTGVTVGLPTGGHEATPVMPWAPQLFGAVPGGMIATQVLSIP